LGAWVSEQHKIPDEGGAEGEDFPADPSAGGTHDA
jgi:hypothetical protein